MIDKILCRIHHNYMACPCCACTCGLSNDPDDGSVLSKFHMDMDARLCVF